MFIKKETEYAILGLVALAKDQQNFHEVKTVARNHGISPTLLAKIFQKLAKSNIIVSKLGPNGGSKLVLSPKDVSLLDVIQSIQGIKIIKCYSGKSPYCPEKSCPLKKALTKVELNIVDSFNSINLSQLVSKEI